MLNKDRLSKYVKDFSFPRLAGTEGEEKAVELTVETFKKIGFEDNLIEEQSFEFSDFYSTTLIKFIMLMNFNFMLILMLFIYIYLFITIFLIAGMSIVVILIIKGLRHPEEKGFWGEYFGDDITATNVTAKIPAKELPYEEAGDIIISAHLDSKSQSLKTAWRIVTYRVWLFSGILLGGFYFALLFQDMGLIKLNPIITFYSVWTLTFLIMGSNCTLMFLNTHNRSPGALDNASGMAIVFELSNFFRDHPLNHFNLWFCQFSAEELGTMGSRFFVNKYEDKFVKGRVFQINSDMVSSAKHSPKKNIVEYLESYGVFPRKKIAPLLSTYLDRAADQENVKINGFHLTVGAHLDSVPFHLRGYSALDITTRAAALYTHNEVDTPDKVDAKVLLDACIIIRRAVLLLDEDYEILCKNNQLGCEAK